MRDYLYRVCGLAVATDFELPGLVPSPAGEAPDVTVARDAVPAALPGATHRGPAWQASGERILLDVPGVARFLISGGDRIAYEPAPGRDAHDFAAFLLGSALGALLHQRNCLVLHGGAVEVNGRAVVFCGPSGAGKSSLVARLCGEGYPLVADDVCVIRFDAAGRPVVYPDGRRLKLWADSVEHLELQANAGDRIRRGIEKFWVEAPSRPAAAALPLDRVYFLREARPPHAAGIDPMSLLEAAETLRCHAYRPRLVQVLSQDASWLQQSVRLLRHARAYWFTREKRFDALCGCVEWLANHAAA
jgi:hypothetical protein